MTNSIKAVKEYKRYGPHRPWVDYPATTPAHCRLCLSLQNYILINPATRPQWNNSDDCNTTTAKTLQWLFSIFSSDDWANTTASQKLSVRVSVCVLTRVLQIITTACREWSWTKPSIRWVSSSRVGLVAWARSPIRERHIRRQIWHSKLLVDGGPDLRRSRVASNSWMRRTSNSSTADLHVERQPVLSIASVSSSEGAMPHWVIVLFRQSLYLLYCPPGRRKPWWSCP